ncbi:MAG: FAD-binding oxidoreductase [Desulfobacteraceae bacterium]
MISRGALSALEAIVGSAHFSTSPEVLAAHATDATNLRFMPDAVAFPAGAGEIARILALANNERFPVVPRGAGSGQTGGALAVRGGLVLAMDRMDRILSIEPEDMIARVEPGVITARLQEAVEAYGLFYPPDPASIHISTIGGNIAECAGGLRAVKYGVTRDYILGLEVVLPTGEIIKTGVETAKGVVGYDLTRLMVGSEGTLGVVTRITVRLIPLPMVRRTMTAFFKDVASAVRTVALITKARVVPTAMELMDKVSLDCVKEEMGLRTSPDAAALLLVEVDGDQGQVERDARRVGEICLEAGALDFRSAEDPVEADRLWEARRAVSPALLRLRPGKVSEDVVVPRSRMALLAEFLEALSSRHGLPIAAFGHAGDGNLHVHIMLDPESKTERAKTERIVEELFREVVRMGGTISGEHGVGITKARYLDLELSEPVLALMRRLKKAFDPNGILNPGKIFDPIQPTESYPGSGSS